MSTSKDPFADVIDKYFKCKKLLKTAEERLFELGLPMEDLTEHESNFNSFKKDLKQLNFGDMYSANNSDFKEKVNEIYSYLEEFFTKNFPNGKNILVQAAGSEDEHINSSQKGLKDILNNIKDLEKKIGTYVRI
jgi:hypothetical protein